MVTTNRRIHLNRFGEVYHTPLRQRRRVLISLSVCGEPSVTRDQCDARPTVTFPATGHHRPMAGTKLYCLVIETHVC